MGASFRANHTSVHAEMARYHRDGQTDRQMAFRLYIVDNQSDNSSKSFLIIHILVSGKLFRPITLMLRRDIIFVIPHNIISFK